MAINPPDYAAVSAAMGVFKTGLDMARSALGTLKECPFGKMACDRKFKARTGNFGVR